ncbi:hypothetical protein G4G27_13730 [Sphingomonas sp. So64.6b]|uniref:hypothetical protein n=1 Tax=Sphingomonas sp. So64.6b TaxID=2997354 RepID=UPI00160424A0|nr:hypothetical protein [Sphingomonas sp. So64.6b]QNA84937.1 hypothetical protein G4G27_13730 [Sphingomonas sp. So64.6b]
MGRRSIATIALIGVALSGCATTSFAPPSVNLENEMAVRGSNYSFGQRCMPNERLNAGKPIPIVQTVAGTQALINNFIYLYRCRAHSAANGRQAFEVPALLVGLGTATAMAFGAPADVAIGGGAATAGLNAGKDYYAPKMKAAIYDSALDALLCIKTEAVGVDPLTLGAISAMETGGANGVALTGTGGVAVTAEQRYFAIVSASLLSVERVLAQRLSNVGSFDPAGVIAEIKTLSEEARKKTEDAEVTADGQAQALVADGSKGTATLKAKAAVAATDETKIAQTIVQIETLQPKLQQCVVRAKI